eukprot:1802902-Pyramimonas_sp.AAC.1
MHASPVVISAPGHEGLEWGEAGAVGERLEVVFSTAGLVEEPCLDPPTGQPSSRYGGIHDIDQALHHQ